MVGRGGFGRGTSQCEIRMLSLSWGRISPKRSNCINLPSFSFLDSGRLSARMPNLVGADGAAISENAALPLSSDPLRPMAPYERIANDFRGAIQCGALRKGDQLPTMKEISDRYTVAASTAHRAIALLQSEGLVEVRRGQRAAVM